MDDDHTGRAKKGFGSAELDVNRDQVYKNIDNQQDVFVFHEYTRCRVYGGDEYEAYYASGTRLYYRSFRALLSDNALSLVGYTEHGRLYADRSASYTVDAWMGGPLSLRASSLRGTILAAEYNEGVYLEPVYDGRALRQCRSSETKRTR